MHSSTVLEPILADPWQHRHQLQSICDALAFSEEVPIRLVDVAKLDKLPQIFDEQVRNADWGQIYQEKENRNLVEDCKDLTESSGALESFLEDLLKIFAEIWGELAKPKPPTEDECPDVNTRSYKWATTLEKLSHKIVKEQHNKNASYIEHYKKLSHALHLVMDAAADNIWLTQTSNAIPIHLMFRAAPSWRVLIMAWSYCRRKQLFSHYYDKNSNTKVVHSYLGMDRREGNQQTWYAQVEHMHDTVYGKYGPICWAEESTRRQNFFLNNGLRFYYVYYTFHKLFEDQRFNAPPDRESYAQAIGKRSLVIREITKRRIQRSLNTWLTIKNIRLNTQGHQERVASTARLDYIALCWGARFAHHHQNELIHRLGKDTNSPSYQLKINGVLFNALQINELKISIKDPFSYSHNTCPDIELIINQNYVTKAESDSSLNFHIKFHDDFSNDFDFTKDSYFYLEEIYRDNQQRYNARIRNYNSFRISVLTPWIERRLGSANFGVHSGNDTHPRSQFNPYLCRVINEMTRADHTMIWLRAYDGRLELASQFSRYPNILLDKKALKDSMEEEFYKYLKCCRGHGSNGTEKCSTYDNSRHCCLNSLSYRSLRDNLWQFVSDDEQSIVQSSLQKFKSALAVPLRYNGRVLGILAVRGIEKHQFLWSQLHTLVDLAELVAPHFYHQRLITALRRTSDTIRADVHTADYAEHVKTISNETADELAKQASRIFLADGAIVWIRDPHYHLKYNLAGLAFNKDTTEYLNKKFTDGSYKSYYYAPEMGRTENHASVPLLWFANDWLNATSKENSISKNSNNVIKAYVSHNRVTGNTVIFDDDFNLTERSDYNLFNDNFSQRAYFFRDLGMSELFSIGIFNVQGGLAGCISLYSRAAHGFSCGWQSIIELFAQQLRAELAMVSAFEAKRLAMTRLILHELRQANVGLANKLRTNMARDHYMLRTHGLVSKLVGTNKSIDKSANELIRSAIDSLEALREGQETSQARFVRPMVRSLYDVLLYFDDDFKKLHASDMSQSVELQRSSRQEIYESIDTLDVMSFNLGWSNEISIEQVFGESVNDVDVGVDELNVAEYVVELGEAYRGSYYNGRQLYYNLDRGGDSIRTFPKLFKRALGNLVDNAFKYSPSHSTVSVNLSNHRLLRYSWRIEVVNESVYLPPNNMDIFFAEGWRGEVERKVEEKRGKEGDVNGNKDTSNHSMGLGLHLTKQICEELLRASLSAKCKRLANGRYEYTFTINKV